MTVSLFCPSCASLLPMPGLEDAIVCACCGLSHSVSLFENRPVVTKSRPALFKIPDLALLEQALAAEEGLAESNANVQMHDGAVIRERCPKCDHHEMIFHTRQMRSSDEGQTVFYTCPKCNYKYSLNS